MSLSTSGGYEKFFWANGRMYSHIIDPRTGYAGAGRRVRVGARAEDDRQRTWTKPFFVNGRAWTQTNRPEGYRVFFCTDGAAGTCSWIE